MMKYLMMVGVFFLCAAAAHADGDKRPRPAKLNCTAPRANSQARKFTVEGFNTDRPGATMDAADSDGFTIDGVTTQFCANNGCDNSYCFVFFTDDVTALAQGKAKSVTGMMNYLNSDSRPGLERAETVNVYCSAGK
jgi:hypothetical protein